MNHEDKLEGFKSPETEFNIHLPTFGSDLKLPSINDDDDYPGTQKSVPIYALNESF